jgi:hypothetical protein
MTYANWLGVVAYPFLIWGIISILNDYINIGFCFLVIATILLTIRDTIFAQKIRQFAKSGESEQ